MKKTQNPKTILDDDEIPEEIDFDYNKARPNRFAERYLNSPKNARKENKIMDGIVLDKQPNITLTGILPDVQRLDILDKIKLIRILAEELENNVPIYPL